MNQQSVQYFEESDKRMSVINAFYDGHKDKSEYFATVHEYLKLAETETWNTVFVYVYYARYCKKWIASRNKPRVKRSFLHFSNYVAVETPEGEQAFI